MNDELRGVRDQLLKSFIMQKKSSKSENHANPKASLIKDLVGSLAQIAGKGKDEIVQIISREIGLAVAGVIKEPVLQLIKDRKIQISIELVEPDQAGKSKSSSKKKTTRSRKK